MSRIKHVLTVAVGAAACVALAQAPANAVGSWHIADASNGRGTGGFNSADNNKFRIADTKADGYGMVLRIKLPGRSEITSCDDRDGANNGYKYCRISNIPHNTEVQIPPAACPGACVADGGLPAGADREPAVREPAVRGPAVLTRPLRRGGGAPGNGTSSPACPHREDRPAWRGASGGAVRRRRVRSR
ncbi:hypothetical protein [Streptomyces albus]|uniref:hypothetical protein n=1 Tax=Streptomyces sp. NRRL F-5917 TaxID=1463873 RepID=UPI0004BF437B|nr:hypothetical protein [Streptomyces sp. NRRL F-5917]